MDRKSTILAAWLLSWIISLNTFHASEEDINQVKSDVLKIINNDDIIVEPNESTKENVFLENIFLENVLLTDKQRKVLESLKTDLIYDMENYSVISGDSIAKISESVWIKNYEDLILLNSFLWIEFKKHKTKKNVINIRIWDNLYIPKEDNLESIMSTLDKIKELREVLVINNKVENYIWEDEDQDLIDSLHENIFPLSVQWIWIEKFLKWLIEAQKLLLDPYHPHIVDVAMEKTVSCANLIRSLLRFAVDKSKLTYDEIAFFQKEWLHARILSWAFIDIWYKQVFNLMNDNFSSELVWSQNPIVPEQQENYENDVIEIWKYLEENGIVWSILPLYFKYSRSKWKVYSYNKNRDDKHYNTHQTMLAWVDTIPFKANDIWIIRSWKIIKFEGTEWINMSIFDFIVNFVQQRWDDWTALADYQKIVVEDKLLRFNTLINIKVNGVSIDLSEEFWKKKEKMIKINPDDDIEIYWPIMIDWLHMVNSDDKDKREKMNARTRFYFEFVVLWNYYISELLEPWKWVLGIWDEIDNDISELDVKWVYALKKHDTVEWVVKDRVLKYEKDKFDKLYKNDPGYHSHYNNLLNYYYWLQIKALKIVWYMQSESRINPHSFNINAPIPYFVPENINKVFMSYIAKFKEERKNPDRDVLVMKNYLKVTTLPGDSYMTFLNRIKEEVLFHWEFNNDIYPSLYLFSEFNELQQREFLEKFLLNALKTHNINIKDFLNWKIWDWINMLIRLYDMNSIVEQISKESFSPDLDLDSVDEFVIDLVIPLEQNNNIVENIVSLENYTPVWRLWRKRLLKQFLEYNPIFQQKIKIDEFKIRMMKGVYYLTIIPKRTFSSEINSHWDFQLRLPNLYVWLDGEWPNKQNLEKALSYFDTDEFNKYVEDLPNPLVENTVWILTDELSIEIAKKVYNPLQNRIDEDLKIVEQLKNMLAMYDESNEQDLIREWIIAYLYKLLLLDDWTWSNVVWKIIWVSLLNDKVNLHFKKLNGILQVSGERFDEIYNDGDSMESYEKVILLINNQNETRVVYGLAENYIVRIIQTFEKSFWLSYDFPNLKKTWGGQLIYWPNTFKANILKYNKILDDIENEIDTIEVNDWVVFTELKPLLYELRIVLDSFHDVDNKKYTVEKVYDLFKNEKIKELLLYLWENNTSTSILPSEEEFSWTEFRNTFFRYINTRNIEREWPSGLSLFVPDFF